jgi:hypothetical protein
MKQLIELVIVCTIKAEYKLLNLILTKIIMNKYIGALVVCAVLVLVNWSLEWIDNTLVKLLLEYIVYVVLFILCITWSTAALEKKKMN